jgi:uncharacterized membrane protein (DUF4010 family)
VEPYEPHLAIATAIAVGLLIGLEREQAHPEDTKFAGVAGVRTYPIVAIIGALAALLEPTSMWLPLVALAGVVALLAVSYHDDIKKGRDHGLTTEVSVIVTYLLGALAASHGVIEPMTTRFLLVAIIGVALTALLSSKTWLHAFAAKVSRDDFYATLKFLIVAVVVLPLLPRHAMGPLDAIVPSTVGLMVVTISGLSFIGYVAMKLLGPERGLLVGAIFGGLVSSTAVTLAFSGRAKQDPTMVPTAAAAIAIASTIMLIRVAVLVGIVNPGLLNHLGLPLVGAAMGSMISALLVYRKSPPIAEHQIAVANPFELGSAIRFGLVFGVLLLATKAALVYLGDRGVYLAAMIGGTTDVDAVTLSTAKLSMAPHAAVIAILVAIASNTIIKSTFALVRGGRALGKRAFFTGALIIAGEAAGLAASLVVL